MVARAVPRQKSCKTFVNVQQAEPRLNVLIYYRWARGQLEGGYPPLFLLSDPPLAFKTTPTPSEMALDPLPQISSFLSWRRFFFRKKNSGRPKNLEAGVLGTWFCQWNAEISNEQILSTPLQPHLEKWFYDPPLAKCLMIGPALIYTYAWYTI